jgi:uncharacterized repeat protein (TIGR04052 family)
MRLAPIVALAIALAGAPAVAHVDVPGLDENGQCVGDANLDGAVAINELILAVNNALGGCPRLPVTLNFRGVIGDKAFACGTVFTGLGTGSSQFIPADFRFYVSNVRLVTVEGDEVPVDLDQDGVWQYQNVAMLDFETGPDNGCGEGNAPTNTTVHGTAPAGVYRGVKFDLGLPFALDHADASVAPSPLNLSAMFWTWNDGYKFLRIDTVDDKFRFHLGSMGCNGSSATSVPTSCSHPNLPTITLMDFDAVDDVIVADIASLLSDSNIDVNQPNSAPGCQSDPDDQDCVPLFNNLGLSFPDGLPNSSPQKFFRVESASGGGTHVEIDVASSSAGGGHLIADPQFDVISPLELFFAECFGGTGDDCTGGMRLFTAANPGFVPIDASDAVQSLFTLADGTPVTLTITALDAGLTLIFANTMLDHVGASVLLGQTPNFHADLQAQLVLPGGGPPSGTFAAGFQLSTSSSQYQSSDPIRVKYVPSLDTAPSLRLSAPK